MTEYTIYLIQDITNERFLERIPYAGLKFAGSLKQLGTLVISQSYSEAEEAIRTSWFPKENVRIVPVTLKVTLPEALSDKDQQDLAIRKSFCDVDEYGQ